MGTADALQLVDELVKARIPKPTATKLVDRIDNNKSNTLELEDDIEWIKNDVRWLRWIVTSLVALMFGIVGIVTYLHNDMKAEIQSVRTEVKTEINSVRTEINSLRTEMKTEIQSLRTEMQSMQKEINAKIDQMLI